MSLYERLYFKLIDVQRKVGFRYRRFKYSFHPRVHIGRNVRIWRNVKIEVLYGGEIWIGDNTELMDGVLIWTYGNDIRIGNNCSINPYTVIYGHGTTQIGNDVLIAAHSMVVPSNHKTSERNSLIREQGLTEFGIVIKDDVWIAHGCSILDNIIVEKGTVVGAGSVLNQSTEEFGIYVGSPARMVNKRGSNV